MTTTNISDHFLINIWNRLPSQTVDFSTLSRFRKSIEVMELDMLTSLCCCIILFLFLVASVSADCLPGSHATLSAFIVLSCVFWQINT